MQLSPVVPKKWCQWQQNRGHIRILHDTITKIKVQDLWSLLFVSGFVVSIVYSKTQYFNLSILLTKEMYQQLLISIGGTLKS